MPTYQRIMRKARVFVAVRDRMSDDHNNPAYWERERYMNLFACFFNSAHPTGKQGQHRAYNIRIMRYWRLTGALNHVH
jgi:hypothetical protein